MHKFKILILCARSKELGNGHYSRSKLLKDYLIRKKINSKLLIIHNTKTKKKNQVYSKEIVSKDFLEKIKSYNYIIFDFSNKKFFKNFIIRKLLIKFSNTFKKKILIIDSLNQDMLSNDIDIKKRFVLCPYFLNYKIKKVKNIKYYLGTRYFLIRKNRYKYKFRKQVKSIIFTSGGSDNFQSTIKFLKIFKSLNIDVNLNILIGPMFSKSQIKEIKKFKEKFFIFKKNKIILKKFKKDLVDNLKGNDIVISSSGLTKYEVLQLEIPLIVYSENSYNYENSKAFYKKKISLNLKNLSNSKYSKKKILNFIKDSSLRKMYIKKSKKYSNFNGCAMVYKIFVNDFKKYN